MAEKPCFRVQYIEIPGEHLLQQLRAGLGKCETLVKLPEVAFDLRIDTKFGTHPRIYYRKYVEDPEIQERHLIFVETGTIFEMEPGYDFLGSIHLFHDTLFLHVYINDPDLDPKVGLSD